MLTIQKVKANQSKAQPTHLPLKCMVPLLLPPTQYVKDGIPKKVQSLILCDSTGFLKATSFDVTKTEGLKVNSSIILKNFISRADAIIITQSTKIFKTTPLHVEEAIVNAAILHLRPPTPPPSSYSAIKMSPVKSIQTVVGKLVQGKRTAINNRYQKEDGLRKKFIDGRIG
ncbi:hypothetical protein HOLleu_02348 [Holothuria leucospilota]|uniref:Uncharacterized protein n=1 Tax=Holothuria leucospilota TaxID=206669 RepID=A0A9Q1CPI3_HOLLE|nr:hypothetical protein HOLleu_02348 [Holothuria leucospilota]